LNTVAFSKQTRSHAVARVADILPHSLSSVAIHSIASCFRDVRL